MNKYNHQIVMVTDPNRKMLKVYYTENIAELLSSLKEAENPYKFTDTFEMNYRVVYQETFGTRASTLMRFESLKYFTRMQLERLVRKNNPNWLNLYPVARTGLLFPANRIVGKISGA